MTGYLAITDVTLIDGTGEPPVGGGAVVIEGKKIVAAGRAADVSVPDGATIMSLEGMTALPGLIDLHAHLSYVPNYDDRLTTRPDDPFQPDVYAVLWGAAHAGHLLRAGFTTVRDAFAYRGRPTSLALKDVISHGGLSGPQIIAAGYAGMTGTEVDMRIAPHIPRYPDSTADGPWEIRRRVRECVRDGYEWIKTFTSGGRISGHQEENVWFVNHTTEEMEALVDEAHRWGVGVMVHATTADAIKLAVRAGADTIEHGWPLDDELIEEMLLRGAALVPTISVYSERGFLRDGVEPALHTRASREFESRMNSFRRACESGIRIGAGTDAIPSMPTMTAGESAFELAMMARHGMSAMDAIRAATSTGAQILGRLNEIGTLEPGKFADILVVNGDPIDNIAVLETEVVLVIKHGAVEVDRTAEHSGSRIPLGSSA